MRTSFLLITLLLLPAYASNGTVTIQTAPDTVGQGKTLSVQARFASIPDEVAGEFLGKRIPFFMVDSLTYRALIGIPVKLEAGTHELVLRARAGEDQGSHTQPFRIESRLTVTVSHTEFRRDTIDLPSPELSKLTSENLAREGKVIGPKFRTTTARKMWQGAFIFPARGPISSPFGRRRVYGDGTLSWHHKGIDIAGGLGDSVWACGAGSVILCQDFVVHGKTIMIDHGHGVVSVYCHMNETRARLGDVLEGGELIGTVGQTGVSTGPHLHWGVSVGNVRVDPVEWTNRSIR